mgnify:CR=1 FL=1
MDVSVSFRGTLQVEDARELEELAAALADDDLHPESTRVMVPGVNDGGLTVGIALAGLALSAIDTLVSSLHFWLSTRPRYSATIKRGEATYTMSGLDRKGLLELSAALKEEGDALPASITLASRD